MNRLRQKSITVWIPEEIHADFKKFCASETVDMSEVLRTKIIECVFKFRVKEELKYEQY